MSERKRDRAWLDVAGAPMQENQEYGATTLTEGSILADKYRVERVIGSGGMGVVVVARHLRLDEPVAIKCLLPRALEQPDAVARFIREAKAAVRIKNEHVVRVSDVGTMDNGAPYMVMEYLEGSDLAQLLQQRGVFEIERAVEFVLQALEAIADAHALGIIHRDLKPSNLFCVRGSDGLSCIKVLDFGISKLQDPHQPDSGVTMTAPTSIMGSPLYMSPEQMRSARDVDARTDIWAVGVILYELLTGVPPFAGDTVSSVCVKAASCPPPPIRDLRPELPPQLEAVILRCLEKQRERRYANVAELATALLPFAPRRAHASADRVSRIVTASGVGTGHFESTQPSVQSVHAGSVHTEAGWGKTRSRENSNRRAKVGLAVSTVVGLGIVVTWYSMNRVATRAASFSASALTTGPHSAPILSPTGSAPLVFPIASPSTSRDSLNVSSEASGEHSGSGGTPAAVPSAASAPRAVLPRITKPKTSAAPRVERNTSPADAPDTRRDLFASPH